MVDTVSRIRNLPVILEKFRSEELLIVVSAMGKTTNALEKVAEAFYSGNTARALELFREIKTHHLQVVGELGGTGDQGLRQKMNNFFYRGRVAFYMINPSGATIIIMIKFVCIGELLSTSIVSYFLGAAGFSNQWVDVRDVFATDDQFRAAGINWEKTTTPDKGRHISDI